MTNRDTIFISHVTPEDNSFAIWLASRLKALGYATWVDKKALLGGEKFWQKIDHTIRHKAVKILLVYSGHICINGEPGRLRDGIEKELSLAESVSEQNGLEDFIILMNIDGSAYNLFIGANRINHIPFYGNWAEGLDQLTEKLDKDKVHRSGESDSSKFAAWYENQYTTKSGIIYKSELYYTNLWPIPAVPERFYLYQFETEEEARAVYNCPTPFPIAKVSNVLSTFSDEIPLAYEIDNQTYTARLRGRFVCDTAAVVADVIGDNESFPTPRDYANHLKSLLARVFHLLMKQRKMYWYGLADKSQAYYQTPASLVKGFAKFEYPFRKLNQKKRKSVYGKYLDLGYWHYAVSCKPIFTPLLSFSLKSHIIFTTDGFKAWDDKDKMHTHRRAKGKRLFNAEWRDMQLSFLHSLRDSDGDINIGLNNSFLLQMQPLPVMYWSDFGYFEPKSKDRFDILSVCYEEDDNSD
ncbi:MAG: toll/interleukin-1 receptor domain-containing protein [Desulfovibrionales bacterium]|nr:toll/interleukin-1 receptor domain-containing protein [Desulfovibrionales bacterium]